MNIAVDIVLIPREADILFKLSQHVCTDSFRLSKEAFPHVSLAMGFVDHSNINLIAAEIKNWDTITLICKQLETVTSSDDPLVWLPIAPSIDLTALHEKAMDLISKYRAHGADALSFVGDVSHSTSQYVSNYEQFAFENYTPHFTLGTAKSEVFSSQLPTSLVADVALFQLGNRCTCAKRLC